MKKGMAVITALTIGIGCCSTGMAAMAEQNEGDGTDESGNVHKEYVLGGNLTSEIDWDKAFGLLNESVSGDSKMDTEHFGLEETKTLEDSIDEEDIEALEDNTDEEETDTLEDNTDDEEKEGAEEQIKNLQMPQKLDVVIDPWEVDRKGQIYSEEYVIRNTGEETGILTLSNLTCKPQETSGVVVRTDQDGIHDDESKSIYMEMLVGTEERLVLSEDGTEYKAELKPGEELTVQFTGEVNEHASNGWRNGDITLEAVYSWNKKEKAEEKDVLETSGDAQKKDDMSGDVQKDESETTEKLETTEKSGDISEDLPAANTAVDTEDSADNNQGNKIETIGLDIPKEEEIGVGTWTVDENGQIAAPPYVLRNEGETPGILVMSNLRCEASDQSGILVRMKTENEVKTQTGEETDKESMYMGENPVFIELMTKETDGLEEQEDSEYKVELEPGEEMTVYFTGRLSEIAQEELKAGKAAVTVKYLWNPFNKR